MRLVPVILESPYGSPDPLIVKRNVAYARACLRDCLMRGESPFASHLIYTQVGVLDDNNPDERRWGMDAGFVWRRFAHKTVVYTDLGISSGMGEGIEASDKLDIPVEYRCLSPGTLWKLEIKSDGGPVFNA